MNFSLKERGFTLIDLMIAMGLGTVAVVTTMAVITQATQVRRIENLRNSAIMVREQLIKNLSRYDNFEATIHHSSNSTQFTCLKSPNYNCGVTNMTGWEAYPVTAASLATARGSNFNLRVARGGGYYTPSTFTSDPFYTASSAAEGFTDDGLACSLRVPTAPTGTAPNRECPIRADLYWWSLCSGTCNPGLIGIKVVIRTYNDANKKTVTTPYGFSLIKSVFDNSIRGPFPDPP